MKKKLLPNLVRVTLGLLVGLGIAELVFRARDEGAFPHVNVYRADAELGARLRPGATEKIRFGSKANPVTSIRIDGDGYRGGGLPLPGGDEVVVVGDSQTFGLGVEEGETFAAVLSKELGGRTVRNLGVPTYGPAEYNAVLKESLAKRPAKTVVWIANMSNDLFEATRPNRTRHVIWDGWAVRKENAPDHVTEFPGRSLLYTHSHAFLAARRWLYERGTRDSETGVASEGSWKDIGAAAADAEQKHLAAKVEGEQQFRQQAKARDDATAAANAQAQKVDDLLREKVGYAELGRLAPKPVRGDNEVWEDATSYLEASRLSPGDIVSKDYGEFSRAARVTAAQIQVGVAMRNTVEERIRASGDARTLGELKLRDELAAKAKTAETTPLEKPVMLSPLAPALAEAQAICKQAGARLIVVALPIDVQVSKDEWKKYGTDPIDMEASRVLNRDVVVAAAGVGAEGLDVLPALAAAEPGAFLDGDLHMTPKGHRAVGQAIARAIIDTKPKVARPDETRPLPAGRTRPPQRGDWVYESEIAVTESDPAGCETKRVREWIGIFCRQNEGAKAAKGVKVERGIDVLAGALPGEALLIAPVVDGQDLHAVFAFAGSSRDFDVKGTKIIGFSKAKPAREDVPGPPADTRAYCKCASEEDCRFATAPADPDCERTYGDDCKQLLACAAGAVTAPPLCKEGFVRAGMTGRCRALCGADGACASGACASWQGGDVCM